MNWPRPDMTTMLASFLLASCAVGGAQEGRVAPRAANHPRLFFTRDDLPELRARVQDGTPAWMYERLLERCEVLLQATDLAGPRWERARDQKENWDNARDILDLSLGYVLSGNAAYRDLAVAAVMQVAGWPTWYVGYEPNRTVLLQAAALAYDWLFEDLGEERAAQLAAKIAFECEQMVPFLSTGEGRGSVGRHSSMAPRTYGPFGVAALALEGEHPQAGEWVQLAREMLPQWIEAALDDDGGFYYSSEACYNTLSLNYLLGFYVAYQRLSGENLGDVPRLRGNVLYQMFKLEPQRDGQGQFGVYTRESVGCQQNMVGLANLLEDGLGRWYYDYVHGPHGTALPGRVFSSEDRVMPILWWRDVPIEYPDTSPRLGGAIHFRGSGKVVLRTGFESVEDIHFALECGPPSQGHSQADVGNFILNAYGERFIEDPGTNGSYAWGSSAGAHSLVLIDDVGQSVHSRGAIESFLHTGFADYLLADQKPAYDAEAAVERARRHVLFVRPSYFVIVDDVKRDAEARRYELLLQTDRPRALDAGPTESAFLMRGEQADLLVAFAHPAPVRASPPTPERIALHVRNVPQSRLDQGDHKVFMEGLQDPEKLPAYFIFGTEAARADGLFMTLLHPLRHGDPTPHAAAAEAGEAVLLTVGAEDLIGFNRGEGVVEAGGCATDARLFHLRTEDGALAHWLVADALNFRHAGFAFSSTARATVACDGAEATVILRAPSTLTLARPGLQAVEVNGRSIAAEGEARRVGLQLEAGEHRLALRGQ